MSTEHVDPDLVEQTKQQIRNLVREIAQLSKSDMTPGEFYDNVLNRLVSALAAIGGVVWLMGEGGRLGIEYQINLQETRLGESQEAQVQHGKLLRKVLTSGEGLLSQPHSGGDDEAGGNPTDFLLVMGPLKTDQETLGIIEIFQRPGSNATVQRGYLRFLLQMCELASDFLKTRKLRTLGDRQSMWSQLENFTWLVHKGLNPRDIAYVLANEGRRLIDCDRVSVGIVKGSRCNIEAVSGQDTFDKRSNTVSLLSHLATAVSATGDTVWYTGDTSNMAPQVEEAVQEYIDEAHSKAVGIIPLIKPREPDATKIDHEPPEVIGVLVVEQIADSRPKDGLMQRVDVVAKHGSVALANAVEHHTLFLLPVWETIGKSKILFKARNLPKTIAGAIAAVLLITALFVWPADFNLEGKGTLQPAVKRDVFAAVGGVVRKVLVKHGEMVQEGQVLAEMENTDLSNEIEKATGERAVTGQRLAGVVRSLGDENLKPADKSRMEGERLELAEKLKSLSSQLALLEQKRKDLTVKSPVAGLVVTWQVREMLIHRPVQQGQVLMTVADPNKDWELEIHMPEQRMGHVEYARTTIKPDLPVTYILATSPGSSHEGTVSEVGSTGNNEGEAGNVVLIRVAINKQDIDERRPGASVTAKIYCGRASIGYVWFHDLIAWFQSKILFRL